MFIKKITIGFFCLMPLLVSSNNQKEKLIEINQFISSCIKNNVTLKKIKHQYEEQKYSIKKAVALNDLLLSIIPSYTYSNTVNSGETSGLKSHSFDSEIALTKKYPYIMGLTAEISTGYNLVDGNNYETSTSLDNYSPYIKAGITIPLLRNFLGKSDRITLENAKNNMKLNDYLESETIEEYIKTLYLAYLDWTLAYEKMKVNKELVALASKLYGQTIRKKKFGVADNADILLAKKSFLKYQIQYNADETDFLTLTSKINVLMNGHKQKSNQKKISWNDQIKIKPILSYDQNILILKKQINPSTLRTIKLNKLNLKVSSLQVKAAKNNTLPELNFLMSYKKSNTTNNLSSSFNNFYENEFYTGFEFKMYFENSDKKNEYRSKKSAYKKSLQEFSEIYTDVIHLLKTFYTKINKWQKIIFLKKDSINASRTRMNLLYKKYFQGRVTLTGLIDARNDYANDRLSFIENFINLQKTVIDFAALSDSLYH